MPKPNSRPKVRKPPQPKVHRYIGALFGDDFGRLSALTTDSANAFARKKLDRASQSLQLRTERQENKVLRAEAREYRAAERGLQAELREGERRARMLFRTVRTREPRDGIVRHTPPKEQKRSWPYASTALPRYDGPVLDRRGERGVFARFRYYSRRTAGQGVSQRVVKYVFNGAALDGAGLPFEHSNVGETIGETLCAFDHLEQVNWAGAKNAKLLMHGILAVDHRQTPDEMMACGTRWAEAALGRFDLPYLVTLHAPPPDGDQRNWHLHILWSFRPMVRTGDHEWEVGEMLRTDLDNPAAMNVMREMYAAVMTNVSFETGLRQVYTAKSNADRGLPHEPQVHLAAARTNRARSGRHVAENEDNHERVMRSKAAVLDDDLRHADEAMAREQRRLHRVIGRWARSPLSPLRLPERYAAATFAGPLYEIPVAQRSMPTPIIAPAVVLRTRAQPASALDLRRPRPEHAGLPFMPEAPLLPPLPLRRSQAAVPSFAMSRIKLPLLATMDLPIPAAIPAQPTTGVLSPVLRATGIARLERTAWQPRLAQAPASVQPLSLPGFAIVRPKTIRMGRLGPLLPGAAPAPPSSTDLIEQTMARTTIALGRAEEREAQEQAVATRARLQAAEHEMIAQQRRASLHRLLGAIIAERRRVTRDRNGRHTVDVTLLKQFGLNGDDLAGDTVQRRLAAITDRQSNEVMRINSYVRQAPQQLRASGDRWTLDDDAPADIRALVDAWSGDRYMQVALNRVARSAANAIADTAPVAGSIRSPVQSAPPRSAWSRAREFRDQAMRTSDDAERLDGAGGIRPGRQIERPGTPEAEETSTPTNRASRAISRIVGPDVGR